MTRLYRGLYLSQCQLFIDVFSTLSSGLNSLPIITWEDFLKPMIPTVSDGKATLIGKFLGMNNYESTVIEK